MVDENSLARDISSDVSRDNLWNMILRFRWVIIGITAFVVALVAGNEIIKANRLDAQTTQTDAIVRALAGDAQALAQAGDSAMAQMMRAHALAEAGDQAGAIAAFQAIIDDSSAGQTDRALAELNRFALDPAYAPPSILTPVSPFYIEAKLTEAQHMHNAGDDEGARTILAALLNDPRALPLLSVLETNFLAWGGNLSELSAVEEPAAANDDALPADGEEAVSGAPESAEQQ